MIDETGGAGGAADGDGCSSDQDCLDQVEETTPADCVEGKCDPLQKRCEFSAKDADEDGHRAKACDGGLIEIETGDDCDDSDPDVFPGSWDGPAEGDDAAKPDRCDEVDQNCDGTADNDKATSGDTTSTCKCDPDNPRACYEYPNGVPILAGTLDIGICHQGVQSCTDGVPGACVGAVGPTNETCNDADDDCDGEDDNDAIGAVTQCPDADGDSYCTADCVVQCDTPEGFRPQSSCLPGIDCDDSEGADWIHPGGSELCGDGIDSNCTGGDNDMFSNLGAACINGQYGVCRRTGNFVCAANKQSTVCNAASVSPGGGQISMSTAADIDLSTIRGNSYDPRWDFDCDNAVTLGIALKTGSFRPSACGGNYEAACNVYNNNQATCQDAVFGAMFFNCESSGGLYLSGMALCGHYYHYISCLWEWNDANQCNYLANTYTPNNGQIDCY